MTNRTRVPSLVDTVLLKHPEVLRFVKQKGWVTPFQRHFQKHHVPSFSSRFLSLVLESLELGIPIHYVLEIGKNYLVSIETYNPSFRIEIVHLHTTPLKTFQALNHINHMNQNAFIANDGGERPDPFYTLLRCESWESPLPFLIILQKLLETRTIQKIFNFHGNQLNTEYTRRGFLQRLKEKPISNYEWDLRFNSNHLPSFQKNQDMKHILLALDLKVNQKHPQDFGDYNTTTFFESILDFQPYSKEDWYESMLVHNKKKVKRIRYKKTEYEPFPLYP